MSGSTPAHPSAQRFDQVLARRGLNGRVRELPSSTRTAVEAAEAVGCDVGQIVKSLVFRTARSGHPVLVLTSGRHRVDEREVGRFAGEPLVRADPEFVRTVTGFAIGGVPPAGHPAPLPTYVDYDLLEFRELWAAAGHPHAICRLTPTELLDLTGGRAVPVAALPPGPLPRSPWITFDCYGTLVDWRRGLLTALEERVGRLTAARADAVFRGYLRTEMQLETLPYRRYREIMAEAIASAASQEGIALSPSDAERIPESIPGWPLFPDTREGLARLRDQGFHTAILSNIDRDLFDATLRAGGLDVSASVTAEEVGAYKPAPAHWVRFLKGTGAPPEEVWHAAGSYEHDVSPAARLGFRTALVARYPNTATGPAAKTVVSDLAELAAVVTVRTPGRNESRRRWGAGVPGPEAGASGPAVRQFPDRPARSQ